MALMVLRPMTERPLFRVGKQPYSKNPLGSVSAVSRRAHARADIYEDSEAYVIKMDVPGFEKDNLKINYESGRLSITGQRSDTPSNGLLYHLKETEDREFTRSFILPRVTGPDAISAEVQNGVLTVKIAKVPEGAKREVKIS